MKELARVADRDAEVQAWVTRHTDELILKEFASAPSGPLKGWTLGVKDVIDTCDLPTERGSSIYSGNQPRNDAACVALAREAGATITGKTVTTEFALFTPNATRNPHDLERTPGGSSSGSAAAVADMQVRSALGTQTVGSVIRPAAFCGVVGFKPTRQLLPLAGVATLSHALDTIGWFTRDVADSITMFNALTNAEATQNTFGGKVGRYLSHQANEAQPEALQSMETMATAFAQAGVEVVELEPQPHLESLFEAANLILHYETKRVFTWERANSFDAISPLVQRMFAIADSITYQDYVGAQSELQRARESHSRFMANHNLDALFTPSAPGEAPLLRTTGDSVFNRVWTSLGVPAIHIPVLNGPNGLPVGVQLVGQLWSDKRLLAAASFAESSLTGQN